MNWLVLIASGVMESVWAIALGKSEGFTHAGPTVVFVVALVLSMLGLSFAVKTLPTGTAYAVWVGIGAALTVIYGMVTGSHLAYRRARRLHHRAKARKRRGGVRPPRGRPCLLAMSRGAGLAFSR